MYCIALHTSLHCTATALQCIALHTAHCTAHSTLHCPALDWSVLFTRTAARNSSIVQLSTVLSKSNTTQYTYNAIQYQHRCEYKFTDTYNNAVLCCPAQCSTVQCSALHCSDVQYTAQHCTAVHCTVLHCTVLLYVYLCWYYYCIVLHCIVLFRFIYRGLLCCVCICIYAAWRCPILHWTVLHITAVYCVALDRTALRYCMCL